MALLDDIVRLLTIQEKERGLLALEAEKGGLPLALRRARERIERAGDVRGRAQNALRELRLKRKELELESEEKLAEIAKYEKQLFSIKSNVEYRALQKEIAERKVENSRIEDRILELMEEIEEKEKDARECEKELTEAKERFSAEEKRVREEAARLDGEIASLKSGRDALLPEIDGRILRKYRRIFANKRDTAVVPLENYTCGGCHMRLPPQVANNVRKANELVICENCSRILYLPEAIARGGKDGEKKPSALSETRATE